MSILYLLIPLTLILLAIAVWAFFWAVKNDQFEDLEGPAHRILFDEDENDLRPEERRRRAEARRVTQDDAGGDPAPDNDETSPR
ncbi:cbb3-type cytochrome oxidase assembly protein CcoS [Litchfieldella rifensis]|uniref:Cbb3-type cytochrome oxidase assembly protein CcoS n=1 Tax=Litchfieldella rifensis TaxID=762643 RepID=A0ABV7LQL4_9GAMM